MIARAPARAGDAAVRRARHRRRAGADDAARVLRETPASAPAPAARQVEAAVRTVTPEQAVTEAIRAAAPRQAGLRRCSPISSRSCGRRARLRRPFRPRCARPPRTCLSLRVPLDEHLAGADLKQAFVRSGVLFEPRLAAASAVPPCARFRSRRFAAAALSMLSRRRAMISNPRCWSFVRCSRSGAPAFPRRAVSESPKTPSAGCVAGSDAGASARRFVKRSKPSGMSPTRSQGSRTNCRNARRSRPSRQVDLAKSLAAALTRRDAPEAPAAQTPNALPPPYRGAPLAAQAPAAPSIAPDAAPHEIAAQADRRDRRRARAADAAAGRFAARSARATRARKRCSAGISRCRSRRRRGRRSRSSR